MEISQYKCLTCHGDRGCRVDSLTKTFLEYHQPVLCARCHGSNALGIPFIKNAMKLPDTFLGLKMQDLSHAMSLSFASNCTNCHGMIITGSEKTDQDIGEPKCSDCHGEGYDTYLPLYRQSMGHGGKFCEDCHISTRAIASIHEQNRSNKSMDLRGYPGILRK